MERRVTIAICTLLLCSIFAVAWAQTPKPGVAQSPSGTKWEYLVIARSGMYFAWDDKNAQDVYWTQSKTGAYFNEGNLVSVKEDLPVQGTLDALGRHGWELVSTVSDGPREMRFTFKRPYDSARSAREAKIRAENAKAGRK